MKRIIYISLFTLLGFLLQLLVHGLIEIWYIKKLKFEFEAYSLGLTWEQWFGVHTIFTIVLLVAGLALGFWQGKFWWHRIYVLKPAWFRKRKWKF